MMTFLHDRLEGLELTINCLLLGVLQLPADAWQQSMQKVVVVVDCHFL
jgi:hypothetical protein